jgi:hypothetical protein
MRLFENNASEVSQTVANPTESDLDSLRKTIYRKLSNRSMTMEELETEIIETHVSSLKDMNLFVVALNSLNDANLLRMDFRIGKKIEITLRAEKHRS